MLKIPFEVEKSIVVKKPPEQVFKVVSDFSTWPTWSPWLSQEPGCPVTVEGHPGEVGHSQAWEGEVIGTGQIRLVQKEEPSRLDYELTFLKPWKSQSTAGFRFEPSGAGTKIVWWMNGDVPVFLFFMKGMMTAMVGSDYARGLSMLKELLDTGTVSTATEVGGVVRRPALSYVGRRNKCAIDDVGPAMEKDFTALKAMVKEGKLPEPGDSFSIYHTFDMAKGRCEYTSGFVYDRPIAVTDGLVAGRMPEHSALLVSHRGAYRYLGNAWSAAMGWTRAKHKRNKSVPMYEIYGNDPEQVPEKEREVEIHIPVR